MTLATALLSLSKSELQQYQDPKIRAVIWKSAMINFIIYTCFPLWRAKTSSVKKSVWL